MIRIISIGILVVSILAVRLCKKAFNPLTIMCVIWSIILFLSSLCLFNLRQADMETYLALVLGIVFFISGYLIGFFKKKTYRLRVGNTFLGADCDVEMRARLVWSFLVFALVFEVINSGKSLSILLNGGSLDSVLLSVRENAADARGTIMNVINNLIVGPFQFAIFPICAYNIVCKKNKFMTLFILLLLGVGVISSGGRVFVIYLIASLCASFTISPLGRNTMRNTIKKIRKQKRRFVILIAFMIVVFVLLSLSRSGNRLIQHTYLYFSMQPIMFETWSKSISEKGLYGFGEAALNGFTFHILYIIKNIFNIPFPNHWYDVFKSIILVDTSWKPITLQGLPANAYVSAFWYFYLDGRLPGIVIESFIWGYLCSKVFKKTIKNPNMKNLCIYSMILFSVVDSYVRIRFTTGDFVGGLLLLYFVLFKNVQVENTREVER